jgi:hypothetical protein
MRAAYTWGLLLGCVLMEGCFTSQAGQVAKDSDASWIPGLLIAKSFAGVIDLNSDPPGAEAMTSLGGGCRTPCSLEISAEGPFTVTFNYEGYAPTTVQVQIQHAQMGISNPKFAPNPVFAHLDVVAKPTPSKPAKKKVSTAQPLHAAPKKPVAAPQPVPAAPRKPAAAAPATQPAPAQSLWPEPVAAAGFIVKGGPTVPADASIKKIIARPASDEGAGQKKQ